MRRGASSRCATQKMDKEMPRIVEQFPFPHRGVVIVLDQHLGMPVKTDLVVTIKSNDGTQRVFTGRTEFILRHEQPQEREAYLLRDGTLSDVWVGANVDITVPS